MSADALPVVTVVMPVRNEAAFIGRLVAAVFAQDYPSDRLEVIVADGMSTDGTREVLAELQAEHPRLVVVDNPARIVSAGLNLAVARSSGDVIVRIDGHAIIANDFLRENVALLAEHPEAWAVGGPIKHTATTTFGRAVAVAMSHPLGIGNARHRYSAFEGYVEGAQFPAIRRWVFERIGMFDERFVRNQDDEFNYRIRRAGGKVYVSPRVRYSYFVRERINQLFTQYFQYGYWRIPVIAKHRRPTTLRQVAPSLFYAGCLVLGSAGLWQHDLVLALALPGTYASALVIAAAAAMATNPPRIAARLPIAIATIHVGYALGMSYGLYAQLFWDDPWSGQGKMTTISR
jgi:GT2 family glycosyltransferase